MLEELQAFTDTTKIHELQKQSAQAMYDKAMELVESLIDSEILKDEEIEDDLAEASETLFAAEEFAHAYLKQFGEKLEGAPEVPPGLEFTLTPDGEQVRPLTAAELNQMLYDYLRRRFPQTLPREATEA